MQPKDKIAKLAWQLFESVKDVVQADITNAVRAGQVKVDPAALPVLISLINSSLESGYHRGARTFEKSVAAAINDIEMPAFKPLPQGKKK